MNGLNERILELQEVGRNMKDEELLPDCLGYLDDQIRIMMTNVTWIPANS